jgi:two-component system, OmpR family, phosphate regulon response regulator PhoB
MLPAESESPDRVVVIDDEPDINRLIEFNLKSAGFEVAAATEGQEGLRVVREADTAVVIVDLMLPDMLGTAVCSEIRADRDPLVREAGLIILTSRGHELDRLQGLEAGADDYVVKPFSVRELLLRVRALAKRTRETRLAQQARRRTEGAIHKWRGLEVHLERHVVQIDGAEIVLRPLEFRLLVTFLSTPMRLFSRADLLREVWHIDEDAETRTVDTHIRRLRAKLGGYSDVIETIHGFGYRLGAA